MVIVLFTLASLPWVLLFALAIWALTLLPRSAHAGEWVDVQPWTGGAQPRIEYGVPPASETGSRQPRSCPEGGCAPAREYRSPYYPRVVEHYSIIGDQGSPGRSPSGLQVHSWTIAR